MFRVLSNLRIDWSDKKEDIWNIVQEDNDLYGIAALGIDWTDKKEQIWNIAKSQKDLYGISGLDIDWSDRKDEILDIAMQKSNLNGLSQLEIDWEDRKDKILEIIKNQAKINEFTLLSSDFADLQIDWSDKKDEFLELARNLKLSTVSILFELNIDWSDKKDEFFDIIIEKIKHENPSLYEKIQSIKQNYNPIYNSNIDMSLNVNIGPWLNDNIEKIKNNEIEAEKNFLIEIIDRLEQIGVIDVETKFEEEEYKKNGITFQDYNFKYLKNQIQNTEFSDIETIAYLTFYVNKLTKYNEVNRYAQALGKFSYNNEYEQKIASSNSNDQINDLDIKDYIVKYRNPAEEKGTALINSIELIRKEYKKILKVNQELQNQKNSSSNMSISSLNEFLEYWKLRRNKNGIFKEITINDYMKDFYKIFNAQIESLQNDYNISIDEIEDAFIYGNNSLEIEETLYVLKDTLLQQLLEYAKQPDNKGKIGIQYYKKEGTRDINKTQDIIYVYIHGTLTPLTFHTNIDYLKDVEQFSKIDKQKQDNFRKFFKKHPINFTVPLSEQDKNSLKAWMDSQQDDNNMLLELGKQFTEGFEEMKKSLGIKDYQPVNSQELKFKSKEEEGTYKTMTASIDIMIAQNVSPQDIEAIINPNIPAFDSIKAYLDQKINDISKTPQALRQVSTSCVTSGDIDYVKNHIDQAKQNEKLTKENKGEKEHEK